MRPDIKMKLATQPTTPLDFLKLITTSTNFYLNHKFLDNIFLDERAHVLICYVSYELDTKVTATCLIFTVANCRDFIIDNNHHITNIVLHSAVHHSLDNVCSRRYSGYYSIHSFFKTRRLKYQHMDTSTFYRKIPQPHLKQGCLTICVDPYLADRAGLDQSMPSLVSCIWSLHMWSVEPHRQTREHVCVLC